MSILLNRAAERDVICYIFLDGKGGPVGIDDLFSDKTYMILFS